MIRWNEVTWYSKLAAVIFFIIVLPVWTFYLGIQYEKTQLILNQGKEIIINSEGITFEYPKQLSTTYIHTVDWPPQISVATGPFSCNEAGEESARAGKTEKQMVGNHVYCVTQISEGAAGSVYTQYVYMTAVGNNKVLTLIFSLRFVQCANYDEQQKAQCEEERKVFDISSLVDRIVETI